MNNKSKIGKIGEDFACKYLEDKKFTIIDRNYRKPWGEIDIIAKGPDKILAFVEVKTIRKPNTEGITPEDNLTSSKLNKLKRTMSLYAGSYPELTHQQKGYRLDLIAITIPNEINNIISSDETGLTKIYKNCVINYYENI